MADSPVPAKAVHCLRGDDLKGANEAKALRTVVDVECFICSAREHHLQMQLQPAWKEDAIWVNLHRPIGPSEAALSKDDVPGLEEEPSPGPPRGLRRPVAANSGGNKASSQVNGISAED
eukprot:CAMPEP_0179090368 /NCGR_PEP_ID=MMETSP0796-20121207/41224_1 /TAXON_ID=73915 /ORGANISM="Pyrodinium bahamense, Strain pbaha01" /LENGTH=118 /DNA_ID=CAMNT_0020787937 /DNA_START=196 /DNA_END=552 /DNA_ORIENTATION=+